MFKYIPVLLLLIGCNIGSDKPEVEELPHVNTDSLERATTYRQYIDSYRDTLRIDSVFLVKGRRVVVNLQYYCLHDNAVNLPGSYISKYGAEKLQTHNFATRARVWDDDVKVIDTAITKSCFADSLHAATLDYGVMTSPSLERNSAGRIIVVHSISVPLSDVGVPVGYYLDVKRK